ncbi:cell adhesion molecule 2-like [Patiria miniata]|uniref:Ig-like domain-containing protein n=1 Tax=Patiria miniata TaxID=46514 RepID=A0A914BNY9_PATMI|nr:cell adhesion molecule 2-like [Patiria miniata]
MSPTDRFVLSAALLCFVLSFACHLALAEPTIERGPQDAFVREGDTVEFTCDFTNVGNSTIYWYHQESYLSFDRQLYPMPTLPPQLEQRLSIIGDESKDEFTLRITNVQETDEGTYSCLYGSPGALPESAGTAKLILLVAPSPQSPWCSVEPASGAVGDNVDLSCNVQGGKPAPNITYYKENEQLVGPVTNSIRHRYQLKAQDNGVIFTCIMTTPALDEPRNCSAMLQGILPTATILPAVSRVEEGTSTSFQCNGEGLPNIANYSWKVIDTETGHTLPTERYIVSEDGQTLEIAVMENLELVCIVSVPSGLSGNTTARVEVNYREQTTTSVTSTWVQREETTGSSRSTELPKEKPFKQPPCTCPVTDNKMTSTCPVAVASTVMTSVLAVAVIVLIILIVWPRKHYRKYSSFPMGLRMMQAGQGYDIQDDEEQGQETQGFACAAVQEDSDSDGPINSV